MTNSRHTTASAAGIDAQGDQLLQAAIVRRDAAAREIAALNDFIIAWRQVTAGQSRSRRATLTGERNYLSGDKVVEICIQILKAAGQPLGRKELFRRFCEAGYTLKAKRPVSNFATVLWRRRDILDLTPAGYWPVEAIPAAAGIGGWR